MFDWYVGWSELKNPLQEIIEKKDRILMVGCGNSSMTILIRIIGIDVQGWIRRYSQYRHFRCNY